MYADDSKLGCTINDINDCISLQQDITNLTKWSDMLGLSFNPSKCRVLSFSKTIHKRDYEYCMKGQKLARDSCMNDLGLIVTDNLRWDNNTREIVNRANKRLGMVKRCVGCNTNMNVRLHCYTALVRPILEYASVVWYCDNKQLMMQIESVQRRATKYILNDYYATYEDRLTRCNILPLSFRREYLDLIFFYNFYHNLNNANLNLKFVDQSDVRTRIAADNYLLPYPKCNYQFIYKWFTNRIVYSWNKMPIDIRMTELSETGRNTTFKNYVKKWLHEIFINSYNSNHTCSWRIFCGCAVCLPV
jgi:hypothetical protein